ncbi:MAG: alpha/beta hydrolase, partial [Dehalococcoidia bacterium]|nr:alpha/beta hydrolase [Dehalococcoidia bacterium]
MAFIDRDGVQIYYEDHGAGPAILLTHGFADTSIFWQGQVAAFQDRYRVITWDMRGHGQSDSPGDEAQYSEAHTVADMAAILDACGVESAVLGGLSMGGFMSLAFHLRYPGRVRALMLFDTGPGFRNDEAREGWNRTARG